MREEGFVKSVRNGECEVIVKRKTACGENCASCSGGCTAPETVCRADNSLGACPGDFVVIEMDSKSVLKSAFLVYILPIIVFFAVFGVLSFLPRFYAYAGGAAALIITFFILRIYDKKNAAMPYVSEIIKNT